MRIADCLATGRPSFSFEFFPPRTEAAAAVLERTITELSALSPSFVSVTYGAGGTTRVRTIELAGRIKGDSGIEAMAHLTCVGHTSAELHTVLLRLQEAGVENIMALRGDPPVGQERFEAVPGGFSHGSDLIRFIRDSGLGFCIGGAAYPEGHVESPNPDDDFRYLAAKQHNGASFFVTQLFFDNAFYFHFLKRAREAGVSVPIIAGIMPVEDVNQIRRFTQRCGATIPARLGNALDDCAGPEEVRRVGIAWATDQCLELLDRGAAGVHFYTLNRSDATRAIMRAIDL